LPAHQLEKTSIDALRQNPPPPIGTGRFRLQKWDKEASVEIVADTSNYRGRARLDRVIWSISPDFTTAVPKLFSGDADLFDARRPRLPDYRPSRLPAPVRFSPREPIAGFSRMDSRCQRN